MRACNLFLKCYWKCLTPKQSYKKEKKIGALPIINNILTENPIN